jgi:hypothetical protein
VIITDLWRTLPGKFFCISTKTGAGKWKDHFFSPDQFGEIKGFLREHQDDNVYFCPHGFNRRSRTKEEAVLPPLLWADLDDADPKKMVPRPTIAIESSPGRFVGLWVLKSGQMTESLNRRLSYKIGADVSGWDLTQALRFPGTRNFKYSSQPRVRTLWDNGPKYSIKGIDKLLPPEDPSADEEGGLNAHDVYEQYRRELPSWARRELIAKKVTGRVDRSEMLWKLENACIEAGMTPEEALAVIKRSVWNKFAGRRNENEQLQREIQKAVEHQFNQQPVGRDKLKRGSDSEEREKEEEVVNPFKFIPMSQVKREKMDFIWEPYLARGEVSILEGDPGLGKSYLAQVVCGSLATKRRIPTYNKGAKVCKGSIVYFDIENSAGTVTQPRLEDNGFTNMDNYFQVEHAFSIDDEDALGAICDELDNLKKPPKLIVFDTLNTYIGRADTHKASETTQAFAVFKRIAKAYNCSVLVLRHLTKGGGAAMYRGQGSIAFSGGARVVISCGVDPNDTETRAMAITKINFAKAPPALTFRIEERPGGRSEFVWGEFVNLSAQEILDAANEARKEGKAGDSMQEAMEFLEGTISGAAIESLKLFRMAEKRGIDKKMIERAAMRMNIKKVPTGKRTESWELEVNDEEPKKKKK